MTRRPYDWQRDGGVDRPPSWRARLEALALLAAAVVAPILVVWTSH